MRHLRSLLTNCSYILISAFLLGACITINSNGYSGLSTEQKKRIAPSYSGDKQKDILLTEITASDIKAAANDHKYTWAFVWNPYCKGETCKPLHYYSLIAEKCTSRDVSMFVVSQLYDFEEVDKRIPENFPHPVYVIKDSAYGHQMFKGRRRFTSELISNPDISKGTPTHMVFKGNELVYWAADISYHKLDSVLNANQ